MISVDTKKKALVGNFKNPGAAWNKQAVAVKDHDFRSQGLGLAVPYGIYDLQANRGSVFVGASHDTPTTAGLAVKAYIDPKIYAKGIKKNVEQMNPLNIRKHDPLPNWNYTLTPA